ncbi:MAG: MauE/DoxX family redox-associated membrane protein [Vicinamibacterales bacterium]|nr:MauE/DoxX family redox-associated membrane protein [Vicinamibacterales bacterium]
MAFRALVAATFLVAGLAKLSDPGTAARAVAGFGVPVFARPLLRGLPYLEATVAVALAFAGTAWYAAWAAGGLLVLFIAAISVNLARGRRPDCNCFGQVRPAPISGLTIVRNAGLLAVAAALILAGPPPEWADAWRWWQALDANGRRVAIVAGLGLGIGLRLLLTGRASVEPEPTRADERPALRPANTAGAPAAVVTPSDAADVTPPAPASRDGSASGTAPRRRLTGNGLPPGAQAPDFALPDITGRVRTLEDLRAPGLPVVLIFSSPGCESCQALVPKLPALAARHRHALTTALISRDTVERNLAKFKDPGELPVLRQRDYEVAEDFDITTSPAAIVVSATGTIASPLAMGGQAILQLIADTAAAPAATASAASAAAATAVSGEAP